MGIELWPLEAFIPPFRPHMLALRGVMYTPTVCSAEYGIASISTSELQDSELPELFKDNQTQKKALKSLANNFVLKCLQTQCFQDARRGQKRLSKDMVFQVLGFKMLR